MSYEVRHGETGDGPIVRRRVIRIEGPVHDVGSDREHQMRSSRRPTFCWLALIRRCSSRFTVLSGVGVDMGSPASTGGGIIDDQTGLPGYVSLEATRSTAAT